MTGGWRYYDPTSDGKLNCVSLCRVVVGSGKGFISIVFTGRALLQGVGDELSAGFWWEGT